jgi:hypothetical protein
VASQYTYPHVANADWPGDISRTVTIDETGLVLGLGTRLVRVTKDGGLAVDGDNERMLALLSVAARRPVAPDIAGAIEAAAGHWGRGDKALANLRLVFGRLPHLDEPADAWRLRLAEALLDKGVSPRVLMAELGFDSLAPDLGKFGYNPNQPRVPAGNGRDSGRWEAFWDRVVSWLEKPVPEYDTDTGTEVGTQTRGRAIATNPLTVGIVGTAALLGGAPVATGALFGEGAAGEAAGAESASPEVAGFAADTARGLASEARVLQELGLTKNTQAVATAEGRSIPDALTDFQSIEIKDRAIVNLTKQLRIQTDAADLAGRESVLITGEKTHISGGCEEAFDLVTRRSDLAPGEAY